MALVPVPTLLAQDVFWRVGFQAAQETEKRSHFNNPAPLKIEEWLLVEQNNTQNLGAPGCLALAREEWLPKHQPPGVDEEGPRFWETTWNC